MMIFGIKMIWHTPSRLVNESELIYILTDIRSSPLTWKHRRNCNQAHSNVDKCGRHIFLCIHVSKPVPENWAHLKVFNSYASSSAPSASTIAATCSSTKKTQAMSFTCVSMSLPVLVIKIHLVGFILKLFAIDLLINVIF